MKNGITRKVQMKWKKFSASYSNNLIEDSGCSHCVFLRSSVFFYVNKIGLKERRIYGNDSLERRSGSGIGCGQESG